MYRGFDVEYNEPPADEEENLLMPHDYVVSRITRAVAAAYVQQHHYLRSYPRAPIACYGLWSCIELIGVAMFAVGSSEAARAYPFGHFYRDRVVELSRFHIADVAGRNTESWMLARARRALDRDHPHYWAVLSFADPSAGHRGTIYRAVGALYLGQTRPRRAYRDKNGTIHSERQGKTTIGVAEGLARGWTAIQQPPKYRYLILLGGPLRRYYIQQLLQVSPRPYPELAPHQLSLPLLWERCCMASAGLVARLDHRWGGRLARHYRQRLDVPGAAVPPPPAPTEDNTEWAASVI